MRGWPGAGWGAVGSDGWMADEPRYDVLILGGGTAGCVLAARLSEDPRRAVCVVEAGPDYGPFDGGGWPADLVDPREPCSSHDWDPRAEISLSRARVIGGCSAHNAAFVVWGDRRDYDEWAAPGWGFDSIEPYLRGAERTIRTRRLGAVELGPWARAVRDAAPEAGIPVLDDLNDLSSPEGAAHMPVNANGFARWNTAFAYLDDARARENLTVIGDALVDRVLAGRSQGARRGRARRGGAGRARRRTGGRQRRRVRLAGRADAKRDRRGRSARRAGDPDRPGRARGRGEPPGPLRHQRRLSGGPGAGARTEPARRERADGREWHDRQGGKPGVRDEHLGPPPGELGGSRHGGHHRRRVASAAESLRHEAGVHGDGSAALARSTASRSRSRSAFSPTRRRRTSPSSSTASSSCVGLPRPPLSAECWRARPVPAPRRQPASSLAPTCATTYEATFTRSARAGSDRKEIAARSWTRPAPFTDSSAYTSATPRSSPRSRGPTPT